MADLNNQQRNSQLTTAYLVERCPRLALVMTGVMAVALTSGCTSWPEHGQGGDVQADTSQQYYLDQIDGWIGVPPESKGALETQWSLHNLKLDTLVLQGARECIPARVRDVVLMSQRTRRELDGFLLEDARNSLVIMQREIDELERRLMYIKRHTRCPQSLSRSHTQHDSALRMKYVRFQLQQLLNSDNAFDNDSDLLSQSYRERIYVASRYLKQHPQLSLRINGHTDSVADYDYNQDLSFRRARAVADELSQQGIEPQRIEVRAFGEHLPRETNETWEGRLKNRRVHVEILEPAPKLEYFYREMDINFGLYAHEQKSEVAVKNWQEKETERMQVEAVRSDDSLNRDFSHSYYDEFERRQLTGEGE